MVLFIPMKTPLYVPMVKPIGGYSELPYIDLGSITPSALMDVDATMLPSYGGTGTLLKNLVASPADGSESSAYDMQFGNGSTPATYPSLSGSAGTPTADLLFDAGTGDNLSSGKYLTLVGSNTAFLNNMHRTSSGTTAWTFIALFKSIPNANVDNYIFGTRDNAGDVGTTAYLNSSKQLKQFQKGDTAAITALGTASVPHSTQTYLSFGQQAGGGQLSQRGNSIVEVLITQAYNACVNNAALKLQIGKTSGVTFRNGTRLIAFSMFNSRLTNAQFLAVMQEYKRRHQFDYAEIT